MASIVRCENQRMTPVVCSCTPYLLGKEMDFVDLTKRKSTHSLIAKTSDCFLAASAGRKENRDNRKRTFVEEEDSRCTDAIDRGLKHMREKQARLVFASQLQRAVQKRKTPLCLFVNFLGSRRTLAEPEWMPKAPSSLSTRVSEFPKSEPSGLPTKSPPIKFPMKFSRPVTPRVVSAEGIKMLKDLGLGLCPCQVKHSTTSEIENGPAFPTCFPAPPWL
jgi:hypothetical protein